MTGEPDTDPVPAGSRPPTPKNLVRQAFDELGGWQIDGLTREEIVAWVIDESAYDRSDIESAIDALERRGEIYEADRERGAYKVTLQDEHGWSA